RNTEPNLPPMRQEHQLGGLPAVSRLKERYINEVVPALMEHFGYKNVNQVPRVEKIVVNMGVGEAAQDSKVLDAAMEDLAAITGQRPAITRARKSVANFR